MGLPEPRVLLPPAWLVDYYATWRAQQGLVVQEEDLYRRDYSCLVLNSMPLPKREFTGVAVCARTG